MRSTRELKITSIMILSPVLLILISLICISFYSIYSYLMELYQPTAEHDPLNFPIQSLRLSSTAISNTHSPQHGKYYKQLYAIRRSGMFSRIRQSPLTLCVIILLYWLYIFHKKKKIKIHNDIIIYNIEPLETHKKKRRKIKKHDKKQKLRFSSSSSEYSHTKIQLNDLPKETNEKEKEVTEECISPDIKHNWYSPFSTGLDLDIPRIDPLCHYNIHFNPPSPIPTSLPLSNLELLQKHPFIPTLHKSHLPHALGPIGRHKNKVESFYK